MDHEERVVREFEDDALAHTAYGADDLTVERLDWRIDGSKNERAEELNPPEAPTDDVARQRFEINNDVR